MEYTSVHALERVNKDQYLLQRLTLSRVEMQEIRQNCPIAIKSLQGIFEELPMELQKEDMFFFLLPWGKELQLLSVDMGSGFRASNRFQDEWLQGSQKEIATALRKQLRQRGYRLRANTCFRNVDVIETLQAIGDYNAGCYSTELTQDTKKLWEAAEDRNAPQYFFWLCKDKSTNYFLERNVYIENTGEYNAWNYYRNAPNDSAKAYWIELLGVWNEGKVMGNMIEIDYRRHLDYLSTHACGMEGVNVVFKNPDGYRHFSCLEYEQQYLSFTQRYGTIERIHYQVRDECRLACAAVEGRQMFWETAEPMAIGEYVYCLENDRLCEYGYTKGDLRLAGLLDAYIAIQHGLDCYVLNLDNSKEAVMNVE